MPPERQIPHIKTGLWAWISLKKGNFTSQEQKSMTAFVLPSLYYGSKASNRLRTSYLNQKFSKVHNTHPGHVSTCSLAWGMAGSSWNESNILLFPERF